jgi:hypothetical protein
MFLISLGFVSVFCTLLPLNKIPAQTRSKKSKLIYSTQLYVVTSLVNLFVRAATKTNKPHLQLPYFLELGAHPNPISTKMGFVVVLSCRLAPTDAASMQHESLVGKGATSDN